jgi:hypothetical protein
MGRSVRSCGIWRRVGLIRDCLQLERRARPLRLGHAVCHAVADFSGLDDDRKRERGSSGTNRSRPFDNERGLVFRDRVSRGASASIGRAACGVSRLP